MNTYKVLTTVTTRYEETIEASSKEEAEKLYEQMIENGATSPDEIWGGDDFSIDEILED